MNRIILSIVVFASVLAVAETSPNTDLMKNFQAYYERKMKTAGGRVEFHGAVTSTVLDVSNEVTVVTYEDGFVWREKAVVGSAADRVRDANARLKAPVVTRGIPKRLAEARLRRAEEIRNGPTNVNVTVTAGGR